MQTYPVCTVGWHHYSLSLYCQPESRPNPEASARGISMLALKIYQMGALYWGFEESILMVPSLVVWYQVRSSCIQSYLCSTVQSVLGVASHCDRQDFVWVTLNSDRKTTVVTIWIICTITELINHFQAIPLNSLSFLQQVNAKKLLFAWLTQFFHFWWLSKTSKMAHEFNIYLNWFDQEI